MYFVTLHPLLVFTFQKEIEIIQSKVGLKQLVRSQFPDAKEDRVSAFVPGLFAIVLTIVF